VCGACAGAAVSSVRWVAIVPLDAVGEQVMRTERGAGLDVKIG
jgi:hypothetical protein